MTTALTVTANSGTGTPTVIGEPPALCAARSPTDLVRATGCRWPGSAAVPGVPLAADPGVVAVASRVPVVAPVAGPASAIAGAVPVAGPVAMPAGWVVRAAAICWRPHRSERP